jgi:hypothetical protein
VRVVREEGEPGCNFNYDALASYEASSWIVYLVYFRGSVEVESQGQDNSISDVCPVKIPELLSFQYFFLMLVIKLYSQ